MKEELKKIAVLIPTLNPDDKLLKLVSDLKNIGIDRIIIIDDGSTVESNEIFNKLNECKVYHHDKNYGKGKAIKTGILNIMNDFPDTEAIVTADSDGQHTPSDIFRMCEEVSSCPDKLVLGVRKFDNLNMPFTSKIGNSFSSWYFKIMTGESLKDTQTGLRAFSKKYFEKMLNIPGQRYDYEMRVLEQICTDGIGLKTIEIETIYEQKHKTHFRYVRDSLIIYSTLVKNFVSSLSSAIIDVTLFMLFGKFGNDIILSTIFARLISGVYNFILNKLWTFDKKELKNTFKQSIRYIILFLIQMFVSGILTDISEKIVGRFVGILFIKIIVDLIIFVVNFVVQKKWVFKE